MFCVLAVLVYKNNISKDNKKINLEKNKIKMTIFILLKNFFIVFFYYFHCYYEIIT